MIPRAGRRAHAYGGLGVGADGAGRQPRGASRERGLRSGRSTCSGGSEFVPCRGAAAVCSLGKAS